MLCEEIFASKKYAALYRPLVLRICDEEYKKYDNNKDRVKAVKHTLHAMYGAYLNSADIFKKANKLLDVQDPDIGRLLNLHASTKERMRHLNDFYSFIFESIGVVESVLDIGCGLNPFTLPYFPQKPLKYYAFDIDERIAGLNNRYFEHLCLPALAGCMDISIETPKMTADAAFLFKLLPLIERQSKGRSIRLLREINAKFLIITYPTTSLSGKEKGMKSFYTSAFVQMIASDPDEGLFVFAKKQIGNELVYIVTAN